MTTLSHTDQCPTCGRFDNRGVSVDAVIIKNSQILLIKRGAQPCKDMWATPGGYINWDESTEEAVIREVKEETDLNVQSVKLVTVRSNPSRHPKQVINFVYLVTDFSGNVHAADDAQEYKWFPLSQLPTPLAFDHEKNIKEALALMS